MKRRSREINVFSLSAIDLFACAMGAFVLLSLILFQYYLKAQKPVPAVKIDQTAKPEDQIKQLQQALEAARQQIRQLQSATAEAQSQADALRTEAARNRQLAFLGIVTQSKSFVVLIDLSGSMKDFDPLVRKTASELFDQMDDSYQCQIIGFQGYEGTGISPTLTAWQPAGTVAKMDDTNRAAALAFCERFAGQFNGGTPAFLALSTALAYQVEAIFLLTDGEPTDIEDWREIVTRITQENAGKKKIYTVAIGKYRQKPELVEFLDTLSRENGGKFLGVSD